MRAAIGWSEELLDQAERLLFGHAALFAGGFTAAGLAAVTGAPDGDVRDVELGLESLADKSLVRAETGSDGAPRFAMLEVVREYARERLAESGDLAAPRRRHFACYLALAERARPALDGPEQRTWLARLGEERGNLRAALAWAEEQGELEAGLRLAGALGAFWYARDHAGEERVRLEALLAAAGVSTRPVPAAAHRAAQVAAGLLAQLHGDYVEARAGFEAALGLRRAAGDRRGESEALNRLGVLAYEHGDLAAAEVHHSAALAIQRDLSDALGVADSLAHLGLVV